MNKKTNKRRTSLAFLNDCPLNLSEDNMNSIAELRKNELTLESRLSSPQRSKRFDENSFCLSNALSRC